MDLPLFHFVLLVFLHVVGGQRPVTNGALNPQEIVEVVRHGGVLAYSVDVTKCDVNLPPTLPTYSYGDVLSDVYLEFGSETQWRLFSAVERPVNGSRFQLQSGVWRVTELEFEPDSLQDGTASVTIFDIESGAQGKVLANGTLACKMSTGGFTAHAHRFGGWEVESREKALVALQGGEMLTFSVDLSSCTKTTPTGSSVREEPLAERPRSGYDAPAAEYWLGRVDGYRIPANQPNAVEFTSILMGSAEREVFNVRLQAENQVQVKVYALVRSSSQPTPQFTYTCTLGVQGSFHVYRI